MYKQYIKFHKNMDKTFQSVLSDKQEGTKRKKYKKRKYPALVDIPFEPKVIRRRKEST